MGKTILYSIFQAAILLLVSIAALALLIVVSVYLSQWIGMFGVILLYVFGAAVTLYLTTTKR